VGHRHRPPRASRYAPYTANPASSNVTRISSATNMVSTGPP
jgi:hypothetical protein